MGHIPGTDPDEDFYEDDEPLEHVLAAWSRAEAAGDIHLTAPPAQPSSPAPATPADAIEEGK